MKPFACKYNKLFLLFAAIIFIGGCQKEETSQAPVQAPEPTAQITKPVLRILFVGNDYTSSHNMPYILQALAQNDPSAHFSVEVDMLTIPSASLAQLWNDPNRAYIMAQNHWNYVILQPHHLWASSEGSVYLTQNAISAWERAISDIGAMPVFFMNWPLEKDNLKYSDMSQPNLKNYKNMHRLIHGYSKAVAKKSDMLLLPIGDYWMYADNKAINLYSRGEDFTPPTQTDNSLSSQLATTFSSFSKKKPKAQSVKDQERIVGNSPPSIKGSYLNALIIYKMLVDSTLNDIAYAPEGITPEIKAKLISIASSKIKE